MDDVGAALAGIADDIENAAGRRPTPQQAEDYARRLRAAAVTVADVAAQANPEARQRAAEAEADLDDLRRDLAYWLTDLAPDELRHRDPLGVLGEAVDLLERAAGPAGSTAQREAALSRWVEAEP